MSNPYRGTIKVRFADTDANGHAFFGNYFVFADEVLGEYWNELGTPNASRSIDASQAWLTALTSNRQLPISHVIIE